MSEQPKVLLVDDEPDTLHLVQRFLLAEGFRVIEAIDGKQALELYEREQPDLILLDIILPHIDGVRVLKQIREQDRVTGIIMVSALSSERLTIECMQAGADDYVSKPFPLKEIRSRVQQVLEKTRLRRKNAELQQQIDELNAKMSILIRRYIPRRVAERLLQEPGFPSLGGTRQEVTILFVDLRDFSPLATSLPPDRLIHILNTYLSAIADVVLAHEGTLDKFMGDGAMILFNAPMPQEDHIERAIRTALELKRVVEKLDVPLEDHRLSISMGIHTGDAVVGNIGSQHLMNYTAIGDAVVLAKRLQEIAETGQILVSKEIYQQVRDIAIVEEIGMVSVKGRTEPAQAYNIVGLKTETDERLPLSKE